jgi:hypothetical protein
MTMIYSKIKMIEPDFDESLAKALVRTCLKCPEFDIERNRCRIHCCKPWEEVIILVECKFHQKVAKAMGIQF